MTATVSRRFRACRRPCLSTPPSVSTPSSQAHPSPAARFPAAAAHIDHGLSVLRVLPRVVVCASLRPHRTRRRSRLHCRIGMALTDSLDELITSGAITPQLAMKVLQQVRAARAPALVAD